MTAGPMDPEDLSREQAEQFARIHERAEDIRDQLARNSVTATDGRGVVLRHACATFPLAQWVDLTAIKDLLGHSQNSATADTYTHGWIAWGASDASDEALFGQPPAPGDGEDPDDGAAGVLVPAGRQ